jgi:hypothetical protein
MANGQGHNPGTIPPIGGFKVKIKSLDGVTVWYLNAPANADEAFYWAATGGSTFSGTQSDPSTWKANEFFLAWNGSCVVASTSQDCRWQKPHKNGDPVWQDQNGHLQGHPTSGVAILIAASAKVYKEAVDKKRKRKEKRKRQRKARKTR